MEDHGGLILVPEEDLAGDVEEDRETDEAKEENGRLDDDALGLELVHQRVVRGDLKDTHDGGERCKCRQVLVAWAIGSRDNNGAE